MIKIGIELNGIVRDINTQILKYYKKDINKEFDDTDVDKNVLNIANNLDFGSNKNKNEFLYVDYPYEVFGCAKTMHRNLAVSINNWLKSFEDIEDESYDLALFSLYEEGLTIQSSYYFLSKIGSRVREVYFPKDGVNMWDICDVIITSNERIITNKPEGKKVILITNNDVEHLKDLCDLVYDSLYDLIQDGTILDKIKPEVEKNEETDIVQHEERETLFAKIKKYFEKE